MKTFGGIDEKYAGYDQASVLLQPILYDGTSTWGKGADKGFGQFLIAAENMELFDIETGYEVYKKGIHILPELSEQRSPEHLYRSTYELAQRLIRTGKFVTFFGGEHSISIGIIRAYQEAYPGISILQLDAHTDLRPEYLGSRYNHACALHEASQAGNLVQVGIRSMDVSEQPYLNKGKVFFAEQMAGNTDWIERSLDLLGDTVYITLDLDVFDPAVMPATGTPEPGGMDWNTMISYLQQVFSRRKVMGFDIVELAPIPGLVYPEFLVAKLYYKMLTYKFINHGQ
ncbi:MAG: agmatinase [Bacteroidales bacterium]|nr:agmatinase [Bacteroidales bacterium]MBN2698794.1 agmatinase [Bacteroidales bacterium]